MGANENSVGQRDDQRDQQREPGARGQKKVHLKKNTCARYSNKRNPQRKRKFSRATRQTTRSSARAECTRQKKKKFLFKKSHKCARIDKRDRNENDNSVWHRDAP